MYKKISKQKEIFKNYILFNCVLREEKEKGKIRKNTYRIYNGEEIKGLGKFSSYTKSYIKEISEYNCLCVRTGITDNKSKESLLLIDFDNKDTSDEIINGMNLYNYFITNKYFDENNNYVEQTGNHGRHLIVKCENAFLSIYGNSKTTSVFNERTYHVDIKNYDSISYIAPTQYKDINGNIKKYSIICDKLNIISEQLKNFVLINLKRDIKKTIINKRTNEYKLNTDIKHNNTDLDVLENLANLIDPKRINNRTEWIKFGLALKNENVNSFKIFHEISKRDVNGYLDENDCIKNFNSFKCLDTIKEKIGIGTLIFWALLDNRNKYLNLIKVNEKLRKIVNNYNVSIASKNFNELVDSNKNNFKINNKFICNENMFNDIVCTNEKDELLNKFIKSFIFDEKVKILSIKSQMATGKTVFLKELLKKYCETFVRILILIHRIDFSKVIYDVFKIFGFKHYLLEKDDIYTSDRIIISVDSLNKIFDYNANKFDLIIMDELESLLFHFSSKTMKDNEEKLNNYITLCKESNKMLLLDADFNERGFSFCKQIDDNPYFLINEYENPNKRNLDLYFDDKFLINDSIERIKKNENICCVCQSKKRADNLCDMFIKLFPKIKNKIINHTSTSDDEIKNQLINVNKLWKDKRVIIYTPCIESGIDYTEKTIDKMYIFTCVDSNSPRALLQQTGRIRNLKDLNIMVYIDKQFNHVNDDQLMYTFKQVKDMYPNKNDVMIFNELENMNKTKNIFYTQLFKCCLYSHINVTPHYKKSLLNLSSVLNEDCGQEEKKKRKLLLNIIDVLGFDLINEPVSIDENKYKKNIVEIRKELKFKEFGFSKDLNKFNKIFNKLFFDYDLIVKKSKDSENISYELKYISHKDIGVSKENINKLCKEKFNLTNFEELKKKKDKTNEDKELLKVFINMNDFGFKLTYCEKFIDKFFDCEFKFKNLKSLLGEKIDNLNINEINTQIQINKNNITKDLIYKLGFSLTENKVINSETYNKNLVNLFNNTEFQKLSSTDSFKFALGIKNNSELNKDSEVFNKKFNTLLNTYNLEFKKIRSRTKKINSYSYELIYKNNVNEIILNLIRAKQIIIDIKPYEPNEYIYTGNLKNINDIDAKVFND